MDLSLDLEDEGADVTHVQSLARALDAVEDDWSVAVLDINLNGQDVFPAAARLQARRIPFVFCTGHGTHALTAGQFPDAPVLSKPIRTAVLIAEVQRLLKR